MIEVSAAERCPRSSVELLSSSTNLEWLDEVTPNGKPGGLAQLVERLVCTEKVSGSNPLASKI